MVAKYRQDSGDDLYRRSMYTIWKRTVPHPTLTTFDAPDRNECAVRRQKTNTPLQALVLLNDPIYVEASKVIGESISKEENVSTGISNAFLKLTGRSIKSDELELLQDLQAKEYEKFSQDQRKASGWLQAGEYQVGKNLDPNLKSLQMRL